ncbi:c-type cytochrome [Magnetococcus sp. PR-3]|uniref:c-type cytochrome n=1 Tax=Magnetococcus sp. PR-3 TaxID=3120355 RepID=UPI002FCE2DF8
MSHQGEQSANNRNKSGHSYSGLMLMMLVIGGIFLALYGGPQEMFHREGEEFIIKQIPPKVVPQVFQPGQALFQSNCIDCHGRWAEGTNQGPPLIHPYYKPSHHANFTFNRAVKQGVKSHHWSFGDMPPQPHMSIHQVEQIILFIRWWQRQNGIE